MAAIQEKQLFQVAPTGTTIASAYSPGDNETAIIRSIYITEVAGNTPNFQICVDDNGTTFTAATALYWNVVMVASTTVKVETYIVMNNSSGNLAVRTSAANEITFTGFGALITP